MDNIGNTFQYNLLTTISLCVPHQLLVFQSVSTFLLNEISPLTAILKCFRGKKQQSVLSSYNSSVTSSGVIMSSSLLSNIIASIIFDPPIPIFSE